MRDGCDTPVVRGNRLLEERREGLRPARGSRPTREVVGAGDPALDVWSSVRCRTMLTSGATGRFLGADVMTEYLPADGNSAFEARA